MKRLSGIYRILNKVNGKGYVGSSKDIIEKKLGKALSHYADKNNASYDLEFVNEVYRFPAWQQFKKLHKE